MVNCLQCGAKCDPAEATDGRCHICGAALPGSADKTASRPVTTQTQDPDQYLDEENVDELTKPRELSGEYARHVTASWLSTPSLFSSPVETINVESLRKEDESKLVIGPRSVGEAEDKGRADYELMEVIGEGNMGTVFSARQSAIDRVVAVKFPKTLDGGELTRNQFISEVIVSGQLEHPNIVPIYDLAKNNDGQLFYSMKRVEGRPWNDCIVEKSLDENVEILMKVCDAIRFAHDRGIIHRDIKPHNIMVGRYGEVSVMDFGIAIRIDKKDEDSRVTKVSPAGTPAYMAPEMVAGKIVELTPATDVYLLGAVLFEIIAGKPPHPPRATLEEVVLTAARNEIVSTEKAGELIDIAKKAMATDSSRRYQCVDDFQNAIREYWSHAESIALVERGEEHLAEAMDVQQSGARRFDSFDRARFAFQEAIELWEHNKEAEEGLSRTSLAYAQYALETKNYARGIDLLDEQDPTHRELLNRLVAARRRQDEKDRIRHILIAAVAIAVAIIAVGGTTLSVFLYQANNRVTTQRDRAIAAEEDAKLQRDVANSEKERAETETIRAVAAEEDAKREQERAETETIRAVAAEENAKREKGRAETETVRAIAAEEDALQKSYAFEIGLAAETIQRNWFERAIEILEKHVVQPIQAASRGWEWGHLQYLATNPIALFGEGRELPHRVESSAISSDGKLVVAGTRNGFVYVWDRDKNRKPTRLTYGTTVRSVAVSDDGRYIAAAGDAVVKIWKMPVRQGADPESTLIGHGRSVLSVAFNSIGGDIYLLTSSEDGTARLWRHTDSGEVRAFHGHIGAVWSARFSADNRRIVTAGEDGTVRVWSRATGEEVVPRFSHAEPVYAAEFSPNGRHIVSGGQDRRLLVWEVPRDDVEIEQRRRELEKKLTEDPTTTVAASRALGQHNATIRSICFSEDGKIVVSAGHDNTVRVWDFDQRFSGDVQLKELRGHSRWVRSCAVHTEGDVQWVLSSGYDGRVKLWDWKRYEMAQVLREDPEDRLSDDNLLSATYSQDGRWVVTASEGGIVTAWDLQNPQSLRTQRLEEGHAGLSTTGILFAQAARLLTAAGDNTTIIWETATGRQLFQLGTGWYKQGGTGWRGVAAVSNDGRWIATGSDTVLAVIWDARTGQQLAQAMPPANERFVSVRGESSAPTPATVVAFSNDDNSVFVGDENGQGHFFDRSGSQLGSFNAHGSRITAAAYLPDGHLVTAGADGRVVKWSLKSDQPTEALPPLTHDDRVLAMDVSDDGKWILTSSGAEINRAMVHLWDAETGKEWKRLSLRTDRTVDVRAQQPDKQRFPVVRSVDIHPSGKHALITVFNPANSEYRVGRWDWNDNDRAYREIHQMPDVSMATYTQARDEILTVGGRGARLWDKDLKKVTMSFRLQRHVTFASFSHDGQFIVCAGDDGSLTGTAKIWQLNAQSQRWESASKLPSDSDRFNSAVFHPLRNDLILTAAEGGKAEIWKRAGETWSVWMTLGDTNSADPIHQAIFSPEGTRVLTMSADGFARLWSYDVDQQRADLIGQPLKHDAAVLCGAFSRNGEWIVTAGGRRTSIWKADWDSGSIQRVETELGRHTHEITAVAFSREDTVPSRLLTASRDFTVKLWDTTHLDDPDKLNPNELLTLEEHTGEVMSVEFSPHDRGRHVVTAAKDGQVIIRPSVPFDGKK